MSKSTGYAAMKAKASLVPYSFERREPREHDVVIDIRYCGICHSDIHQQADGKRLGADHFCATSDPETFTKLAGSLDLVINTVSAQMDWNQYLALLKVDGTMVVVGLPEKGIPIGAFSLTARRRSLAGSQIGESAKSRRCWILAVNTA